MEHIGAPTRLKLHTETGLTRETVQSAGAEGGRQATRQQLAIIGKLRLSTALIEMCIPLISALQEGMP